MQHLRQVAGRSQWIHEGEESHLWGYEQVSRKLFQSGRCCKGISPYMNHDAPKRLVERRSTRTSLMQSITLTCTSVFEMFNLITTPNYMFDAFIRDAECAKKITLSNWFSKSWKWYPTSCFYRCQHDLWFTTHSQSDEAFAVTKNIQVWTLKIYPKSLRNVKQMGSCQNFWCFHTGNLADLTECEFGGTFRLYSIHFQPGSTYMLWLIANAVLMLFMGSLTCLHLYVVLSHKNKYDILIKLWEKNHSTSYAIQQFGKIKRSFLTPDDFLVAWTKSAESGGNSHADESAKLAVEHGDLPGFLNMHPIPK